MSGYNSELQISSVHQIYSMAETDISCGSESDSSTSDKWKNKSQFKISKVAQLAHSVKPGQNLIPLTTNGKPIKVISVHPSLKNHLGSSRAISVPQKSLEPLPNCDEISQKLEKPLLNPKEGIQSNDRNPNPKNPQQDVLYSDQHPVKKVLLDIFNITQNNAVLLQELSKKINEQSEQLSKLSETVNQRWNQRIASSIAKPDFIPFCTVAGVNEYNNASEEDRTQLRNYISAFRGGRSVMDNVRYILKNNLLLSEELLVTYNYFEPSKGKPNTLAGSTLDRDFLSALRVMYPTLSVQEYHEALKSALKAADSRKRVRNKSTSEPSRKRKKSADFTEDFYSNSSENQPPVD